MLEVRSDEGLRLTGSVVTIGVFDGMHRGHVALVERARQEATARELPMVALGFDHHPMEVFAPERAPKLLMGADERRRVLAAHGVDVAYALVFDAERAAQPPGEFVTEVLVGQLGAEVVVVGDNFTYGAKGAGNVETLQEAGRRLGFEVHALGLMTADEVLPEATDLEGVAISATLVRRLLAEGRLREANALLGRSVVLEGVVAHGAHRGRELGFPTANLVLPDRVLVPADGVYAGRCLFNGQRFDAAVSIGTKPTYGSGTARHVEVHLLSVTLALYGRTLAVALLGRLRGQEAFDSEEALVRQMHRDLIEVRAALAAEDGA
jgi:riboflavin kinase/FMN adenylyltransferase